MLITRLTRLLAVTKQVFYFLTECTNYLVYEAIEYSGELIIW